MRTRFDQLAKEISRTVLGPRAQAEHPVAVEAQAMDLWFEPDPDALAVLSQRALLGRMARAPMGFEAFHDTPGDKDVQDCLRKHLGLHHLRWKASEDTPLARLWIVSAGRPRGVLEGLSMHPASDWPAGVYQGPRLLGVWIVVVSELPRTRDTLALRLMGRDAALLRAMEDLHALPANTWERELLLPVLVRWRFEIPVEHSAEEEAFMTAGQVLFEEFVRKTHDEGMARGIERGIEKGRTEGVLASLSRLFAHKLGRPLSATESATLSDRYHRLGEDRLDAVLLDLRVADLTAWLADPDAH